MGGFLTVPLDDGVLPLAGHRTFERRADDGRIRRLLIELDDDDRAAGELDTERKPLGLDDRDAGDDDQPREADGNPAPAEKIEMRSLEDLMGQPKY